MSADPIAVCERNLDNARQELAALKRARRPNVSMAEALVRGIAVPVDAAAVVPWIAV